MFRRKRTASLIPNYLILILLALFSLVPVILLFFSSLKATADIQKNPFGIPLEPLFSNYSDAWVLGNFTTTTVNTLILTTGTILVVVVIGGLGRLCPGTLSFFWRAMR